MWQTSCYGIVRAMHMRCAVKITQSMSWKILLHSILKIDLKKATKRGLEFHWLKIAMSVSLRHRTVHRPFQPAVELIKHLQQLLVTKPIRVTQKTGDHLFCHMALCSPHWFAGLRDLKQVGVGRLQSRFANTISLLEHNLPDFMHRPAQYNSLHQHHVWKTAIWCKNTLMSRTTTVTFYCLLLRLSLRYHAPRSAFALPDSHVVIMIYISALLFSLLSLWSSYRRTLLR